MRTMPAVVRRNAVADERATRLLADIGRDLRHARMTRGLSQRTVATATSVDQAEISRIERGARPGATIRVLSRIAGAVGLDLSMRLFPGGSPLRDQAHVNLLARFRRLVGERWQWASEVPLPIPGDRRAWDRVLTGAGLQIGVEAETKPRDAQELQRRLALKKRDGQVPRLILVLANTEWNRRFCRDNAAELEGLFPVPGRIAQQALAEGRDPGGDALIMV
jgi:transcriptional regulator with XRE-family HTH domain